MSIRNNRVVVFDCEIVKAIAAHGDDKIEGIDYCDGWRDFQNMGISVICTEEIGYDPAQSNTYLLGEFSLLIEKMEDARMIIGFNSHQFDLPLMNETFGGAMDTVIKNIESGKTKHVDLLREIWIGLGLDPDNFDYKTHGGYGLDAMCKMNIGSGKTGDGSSAAVEWQLGKHRKVIEYCKNDVNITRKLYEHMCSYGLISPVTGQFIPISIDGLSYN